MNTDAFQVFDSFSVFGKFISNQTKLSDNLHLVSVLTGAFDGLLVLYITPLLAKYKK